MSLKMLPYGVKFVYVCLGGHAIVGAERRRHEPGKEGKDRKHMKTSVYCIYKLMYT